MYNTVMATQEDYDIIQARIDKVGERIDALNRSIDRRNEMLGID